MKTIYFAHPISSYNTPAEEKCISIIKEEFPDSLIINPGCKELQEDFYKFRDENPKNYMVYFKILLEKCDDVAYLTFQDDKIGAGIGYEVLQIEAKNGYIYEIDSNYTIKEVGYNDIKNRILDVETTRQYLKDDTMQFDPKKLFKYKQFNEAKDWGSPEALKSMGLNTYKYQNVITYSFIRYYSDRFMKGLNTYTIINAINREGHVKLADIIKKEEKLKTIFGQNNNLWSPNTNTVKNLIGKKLSELTGEDYDLSKVAKELVNSKFCHDLINYGDSLFTQEMYDDIMKFIGFNSSKSDKLEKMSLEILPSFEHANPDEDKRGIDIINRKLDIKIQVKAFEFLKGIKHDDRYFVFIEGSRDLDLSKMEHQKHLKEIDGLMFVTLKQNAFVFKTDNIIKVKHLVPAKVIHNSSYNWYMELKNDNFAYYNKNGVNWERIKKNLYEAL